MTTTDITTAKSALTTAQDALAKFRTEHAEVLSQLARLEGEVRAAQNSFAASNSVAHEGKMVCCGDDHCLRGVDWTTGEEFQCSPKEKDDDWDWSFEGGRQIVHLPKGWVATTYYCGCGEDGRVYCPDHPPSDDNRSRCGECSR